jgi:hypothetical protein
MGGANGNKAISYKTDKPGTTGIVPGYYLEPISFFYDGSFLIFFYACASQFYDAFFFYHKAYFVNVFYYQFIGSVG